MQENLAKLLIFYFSTWMIALIFQASFSGEPFLTYLEWGIVVGDVIATIIFIFKKSSKGN